MNEERLTHEIELLKKEIAEMKVSKNKRLLDSFKDFTRKKITTRNIVAGVIISAMIASAVVYAAQITFRDGDIISAANVNNNFNDLYNVAWSGGGNGLYYNGGTIGIGTDTPETLLDVNGIMGAKGIKTRVYKAEGTSLISLNSQNVWGDIPDLSITFNLEVETSIIASYNFFLLNSGQNTSEIKISV